ncbi:hypothetical protein [Chondromyces crocatus]|uniref:hypothetical protein n=1 Tax=Chondromyces crocatus TaxID=52 RepID=UPI0012E215B8|nr:hypothetical protein [Chondromyces crocatus]
MPLDYTPETLPLLDHYLNQARNGVESKEEVKLLLVNAAGAYFGEVVRRKHASWWRADADDPSEWRLEFESAYLAFSPMVLVRELLHHPASAEAANHDGVVREDEEVEDDDDDADDAALLVESGARKEGDGTSSSSEGEPSGDYMTPFLMNDEDRFVLSARLAKLPPVSEEEYYATATWEEVIDIAVDCIRARAMQDGDDEYVPLEPEDYVMLN